MNDLDRIDHDKVLGIQIGMNYFRDSRLEETRLSMWSVYTQNAQNHSNYLLTMILAIVAFFAGLASLSEDIMVFQVISFTAFAVLLIIAAWLKLRSQYWCMLSDYLLTLTLRDIKRLFNDYNKTNKFYIYNPPPTSAVLLYAVREQMIENQRKWRWRNRFYKKLALTTSGIKKTWKLNNPFSL